jgi:hypothetical protein
MWLPILVLMPAARPGVGSSGRRPVATSHAPGRSCDRSCGIADLQCQQRSRQWLIGATTRAGSADDLIKSGDDLDLKLKASEALASYLEAEKLEPKNASLLVRIARQYRRLMADATTRRVGLCAASSGARAE